ncbi:C40 family peptidase [Marinilabilia salmonicolor]|uniref:C40 family peptidase n=1 Tax=Marinilabilia salmonicolor TaxID=989 RepID=UPI000299CFD6|nr:C40 family peptidase [Marinilabilia salmonicolor]
MKKRIVVLLIAVLSLFSSCAERSYPVLPSERSEMPGNSRAFKQFVAGGVEKKLNTGNVSASDIIRTARKYIGVPHCMGGTTSKCMDCSGLLVRAFEIHGIKLPHNSEAQARYGKILANKENLRKGDLVFFIRTYRTSNYITHSGIYLGNNQFLHTSSSQGVTITSLDNSWWKDKFIFGTRIF